MAAAKGKASKPQFNYNKIKFLIISITISEDTALGIIDQTLIDKQQQRSNAFNACMNRGSTGTALIKPTSLSKAGIHPTIDLTTEDVTNAKQNSTPSGRENGVNVCINVREGSRLAGQYGYMARMMEWHTTMPGCYH